MPGGLKTHRAIHCFGHALLRVNLPNVDVLEAQDGAVVVLRSFMEPPPGESTEWAARDRSMLWGRLTVEKVH